MPWQIRSTVGIYGLLKARGYTRFLGGVWSFIQTDHEWGGGGGSDLPNFNFKKKKCKEVDGGGGYFSFGFKQVLFCDCLCVPLYFFKFNIASEHCIKYRGGGGLGVLPHNKNIE